MTFPLNNYELIGLRPVRGREWLIEIDFRKRELFAYACEAYSCIVSLGGISTSRKTRLANIEADWVPTDDRVDVNEHFSTLQEAVDTHNGWKRILKRYQPS